MVEQLLEDLATIASPLIVAILVTRNVDEPPLVVPHSLASITSTFDNAAPRGFGANHNAAFRRCTSALFVIINPDIRLPADPFPALASHFEHASGNPEGHGVALVAPRIVAPDGTVEDAARKLITPWQLIRHRVIGQPRRAAEDFDWIAGMFLVVSSAGFKALGGFDERYFMYCEDFDLCARLRLAGWSITVEDSVVAVHDAQRESHRSSSHLAWHVTSLVRMWVSPTFWRYCLALRRGLPR